MEIELQDEKGGQLDLNEKISSDYLAGKTINIVLSHNKEASLTKSFPIDFNITNPKSPETLWNEFKKENVDADKLKELDLTGLNDKDIWAKVLERIKTLLKDKFETKFKKTIDEGLEIELQDEKGDKLAENAVITERFKIVLSLKGSNLDKIILNHEIEIVPSPETLWNEFKKENVDADKLKELDLTGLNDKDTWAKVLERIKTLLKDKFETKFKKTIDEGLEIELQDEKGDKLAENAVITERFKIVLSLKGSNLDKIILNHEIEIVPSPETLWNEFKKENVDADKLKELDLTGLNDKDTWAKVLERIKTLLKDKFETKFKKTIDEGLEIELQDEKGDKLAENAVITERFKIVLSLKGSNLDKIILNHEIEIVPSPETLWNEFKKENVDADKLKELDLTGLNDKDTWAKVLERIKTLLKDKFETKFKKTIDEGLEIELQDEKGDKLAENAVITERFKIVLSLKGSNLDKIILNHEIEIVPSPETLWNEFKKENVDADKLKELDLTGLNDKDTWAKVLERIKTLLKDKFETKFKKTIDEGLEIELQDEKGDKLAENAVITERFKIVLSLKGSNLDKIILNHEIEIVPSPETLWNEFKKENVDADKLKELDLTGLNDKDIWAKVLERIKTLLKDKFETKFKKTIDEGLEIELQDEKGDKLAENAAITERFKIVLSLKGSNLDKIILNHEIEIVPSPETLWNEFKKENVDADKLKELDLTGLNDKDTWAKVLERIKTLLKDKFETKFKKTIDEGLEIELQDEKGDKLAENAVITERFKIVLSLKGSNLDKIILNHEIEIVPSPETLWNEFKKENVDADKLKELDLTGLNDKDIWAKVLERIKTLLKDKFETKFKKTIDEGLEIELQDEKGDKLAENAVITERFKIVLSLKGSNLDKIILNHEIEIVPSPETLWNEFKKENVDADKLKELDLTGLNDKDTWAKVLERIKTLLKDKFETKFKKTIDEGLEIELQDEKGDKLAENAVITERFKIVLSLKGSNLDKIILNHEIEIVPSPETLWNEFKKENVDADKLKELDLTGLNDKDIWAKVLERIKTLLKDKFETKFKKTIDEGLEIELQDEKGDKLAENAVITERFKIVLSLKGSNLDKIILNHEIEIVPSPETLWNEFKKENVDADKLKELDLTGLNDKDIWAKVLERIKTLLKDKFETKFKKTIDEGLEIELQDEKGDKLAENAVITERFKIVLSLKGSNLDKIILNHEIEIVPSPETLWNEFKKENVDADKLKELDLTGLNDKDTWAKVLERIKTLLKDKFETKFKKTIDEGLEIELQDEKGDKLAENAVITERFKIVLSLKGSNLDKIILNHEIEIVPSPETLWNEFKKENVDADKLKELDLTGLNDKDTWAKVLERIKTLLKDKFETKFKKTIDEGLEIELQDEKGDKLAENAAITARFKIVLSLKGSNLDNIILNHEIEIAPSPETLWNEFKKAIIKNDKFIDVNLVDWLDKTHTWKHLADYIKNKLKDKYEKDYQLDNWVNNLVIKLFKEKGKEVDYNNLITNTNDYLTKTKIFVKVIHNELDKVGKEVVIDNFQLSEKARWNAFKNNISTISLEKELNKETTWADVLAQLRGLLKTQLDKYDLEPAKLNLGFEGFENLETKLDDRFFKETNLPVKLGYTGLDSKADLTIEKMHFSLTTRWNAFKNNISKISLEKELNKETTWANVLAQLREQLKIQLDNYDLDPAKLNLDFEGFENLETKLDDRFFKAKDFSVDLGYDNLETKANLVIEKMHFSLTARWNAFKNNISKISLEKELNKETTWANVLAQLREQLKTQLDKYDLDPAKLNLDFEGFENLETKLDDRFFKAKDFSVDLGYDNLETKANLVIEKMHFSLTARWNAFKNNISTISLEKELNKETTWADVLAQLRGLLKTQLDKYDLEPAKLNLGFEGFENLETKLDDRFFKETNLPVKLGYTGLDSKADLTIEKMHFSLTTRWNAFKNNISTISLEKELNKETTWADVLAQLRGLLKTQLDKYDLDPAKLNLDFEGFENLETKLDDRFFKAKDFSVDLGYDNLETKANLVIEKMHFSLTTRWNAFKNNVSKISLEKELNKETAWADVLAQLREQLKIQLDNYDLDPAKLNLDFEGFEGLDKKLDDRFFKETNLPVKLGYDKLETKANLVIEKMRFSLTTRWNAFKNNISKISLEKELNKETTWADVLAQLREQLKIQLDNYDLDPAKLNLDFEGFEGLDKKLDDRFFKETNLPVKLGYTGLDSKADLTIEKMHFSLTTRWNAFKNNISTISLEKELNKETTWANVLAQLREQLKTQLDNYDLEPAKLNLDFEGFENLETKLDDRFFKETNLPVKLGYTGLDSKADLTIEKMHFSLTTRWNAFKNSISEISLEKELNKETAWADVLAQLREQLKTQLDKYDLDPAKLSLDFEGFENLETKLDDRFFKETNLPVKLGYTGLDSKADLTIEKMHFSLTTRWNAFKNNISKISLEKELNKETTWANVLAQLREQLKTQLDNYDLEPAKLNLDFEGFENLETKLDDRFFKAKDFSVDLGYDNLETKANLVIEKMHFSLTTRWNAFKNNVSKISLEKELNKETAWADVLAQLREQLKIQLDNYDLDPAKLSLDFEGFENLETKLDDRFFKAKDFSVDLGYDKLETKANLVIEKMHFSLTTRWNAFKNNISTISLEKELNKETTWANVLAQLREQLKIQLDNYDLDPAKLNLDFEGFEGLDKKLDDRFFKETNLPVKLGYDNLETKANLVIEKMHFSLTARWNAFKNNVSKISLEKELNKETAWADVLAQLREQLKTQLDKYDLDPAKLSLDFEGFEGLDKKLDDRFFKAKDFSVDLGYDKLETKANLVIEKMRFSLTTRWNAFKNNISKISLEKELNKETTWADVLAQLREQLKIQLDNYDLDPAKLNLDFEGFEGLDKKLDDRFFKETNLAVKLGYTGLDSKADLTIEKMHFSLTTRWNAFKNNISTISLEKELNKETTWANVLAQLREQLKTQLDNYDLEPAKLNLDFEGFENLETKLDDRFFKETNLPVKLGYTGLDSKADLTIEKMHFSLTTRWNAFKNSISEISLEKELNKETAWADVLAQLREQLKTQLDKYDLDPAKLSLDFEGFENLETKLDDRFFKETNLPVKLGYTGLDSKADLTIEKMHFSLTTRWNAFKNNISKISLEKELNKETTWANVLAQLREQLKIQLDNYDLDPAKLNLDFEGFEGLDKKLDDRFFKETNLPVKLGYTGLDSKADLTIEKMHFSLTTRWNAFKNNISTISLEKELNKETTWANVLAQLREQLKTQLDNYDLEPAKLNLDFEGFENLETKLDDRFFKETNLPVKLGYTGLDSKADLTIEKMHFSLTTRWNAFKNSISKISLEKELNKETAWADVLAQLREQLKTQLDKYDLDPAKLNLDFEGFEGLDKKLDDRFFKETNLPVKLGYTGLDSKADLTIEKMHFSLTTRWNAFKNNISTISLEKELNKETTWANVLAQLREQLKTQLDNYDLEPAKLNLDFEGFENLETKLDDRFFKAKDFSVDLGYDKLETKANLVIEKMHFSLTTRWNAFKNNISTISLEKELNKETTWANVLAQLREQLKIQLDNYDLDPAKLNLDFEGFEGLDKKLDDRFFKETNLPVKLGYDNLETKANLVIEKMHFSLTARWNAFKNNISKISLEKELNKETTWADVLAQLREQLKIQLDNYDLDPAKLNLDFEGFEGLDKKLDDRFFKETNLPVKLGYTGLDSKADLTIEKMRFSLTTRWNAFKNNISTISLEKELNKETTWADVLAQLREQLKTQLDKYDLEPAKLSLDFEGLDKKLDDRFFKETNLAVKLGYIGLDSKADLTIEKMRFSLTTRWNAFKNNISTISLEKELNKETTWADVLAQLREQLKTQLDKYDLEPAKLNLGFEGFENLETKLDDRFFKAKDFSVDLGYDNLGTKANLVIEKMHFSLTARWNAFKNNISKISLEKELNKETTWADVLAQLREQLKIQLDKYDLDPAKLSLDFEGLDKKLDDRFFKETNLAVKLGYIGLDSKADLTIEKMRFSLTTRWNAFKNNISTISLEKELNKETAWADVLAQLREQLKTQLDKYDLDPAKLSLDFEGFENLETKLDDRFFKETNLPVKLGYTGLDSKADLTIEKMHFSLTTRWNAFKNNISKISLEKELNKETTWANVLAQLREQLKTQLDNYDLEPAKLNLDFEGFENLETKLDDRFFKAKDFSVDLGYDNLETKANLVIEKMHFSLTTRWNAFKNNVSKISLEKELNKETAWADVLAQLREQLKIQLDNYDLDPAKLSLDFEGFENLETKLDDRFFKAKDFSVDLGYDKLETKANLVIEKMHFSLTTRWNAFKNNISTISLEKELNKETTWANVLAQLREQLKIQLDNYDLDPAKLNLDFEGFEGLDKKLDDRFFKETNLPVKLGYDNLETKANLVIEKMHFSLTARWNAFKNNVSKISLEKELNKETAWADVLAQLREQLKTQLDKYDLDPAKLSLDFEGFEGLDKKLDDRFFKAKDFSVDLGYDKLETKANLVIEKMRFSLTTRWNAFKNNISKISLEKELNKETTWADVLAQLREQLKIQLDNYDLDPAKLNLDFEGFEGLDKKLDDRFFKETNLPVKLGYTGLDSKADLTIEKMHFSLTTRWNAFKNNISTISLEKELNKETTWANVLAQLREQLKTQLDKYDLEPAKLNLDFEGFENLETKLDDRFFKETNLPVKLGYTGLDSKADLTIEKMHFSLTTRWNAFKNNISKISLEKELNKETTWANVLAQLREQLKTQLDNYDLEPAKLNLDFEGFENLETKLDDRFFKAKDFSVDLGYDNLETKANLVIEKMHFSLTTRWNAFKNNVSKISLEKELNKETAWADVLAQLREQLKIQLDNYDLDPAKLSLDFEGFENLETKLDDRFFKAKDFSVDLGYDKLETKANLVIEKMHFSLTTRWNAFKNNISTISLEKELNKETTWANVLAQLREQLKIQLDNYDLDPAKLNLDFEGFEGLDKKLDDRFFKETNLPVKLGYDNLETKANLVIEKMHFSLTARWNAFKNNVSKISLEKELNKETAWADVLAQLREQLKTQLDKYDLDPAKLSLDFEGFEGLDKKLDDRFFKAKDFSVDLGYDKLETKANLVIEKMRFSLTTRWNAFKNNISKISLEKELNKETTWADVLAQLREQLKIQLDNYDLDPAKLNLDFEGFEGLDKKLDDRFFKETNLPVKLGYTGLDSKADLTIEKMHFSLTTRWNAFKNNISTISLEKELNKETTWANVLAQLREQLKTQLDNYDLEPAKLNLDFEGFENLETKLDDRFFKETNLPVKLGYTGLDSKADLTIEKMHFSLTTRWNAFKNSISEISLEKELNKETAWADVLAQLREQLKTQLDKYDLDPAKLSLDFEGFENLETKLDDRFFKETNLPVKLGYTGLDSKADLTIEKMHFSLTTRWNAFKNNISKISLEKELNKETTWANVLAQLREQLKIQLDNYDLDPAKLNLDFEGFEGLDKKLDDRFFKETNLPVKLGYTGLDSKADLTIEKMHFSLTTRWNAFKNNISTISLEKELNKETTWANVLAQLREQLKTQLDNYDLEPAKLNLDFEGFENLETKLDDRFFKETNLPVKLGYTGLDSKADLTIEKMHFSLTTRWNAFKNSISKISLEKELNKETAWADVLAQLREQLKTQLDKYDLDPAKLNLDFEGFEGLDKKLDDRFFKETNLPVKLGYTGLDSKADLTIEKMHFSLTTRWNAFKNNISTISLEKELNKETTWANVLAQLREQLKTQLDNYDLEPAKLNLDFEGFENLETKLDDRFFKAKDFSVDLGYDKLETKANLVIEKMHFSLTTRWNAFKNNISTISLEKELNKETTWANVLAQLREQLKIQLDNYDLDPAKLNLDFEGFEGLDKKLDDRFFKETNLPVKLGYDNLETKANLVIEKMHFSLTARWNAFKNNISKISLEKELNKETTWADVLAQLREQLKIQLDNYDLDPAKLNLDFEGFEGLDKKLDDRFFKETNLPVKLGYTGLDSKADLTIEKMRFSLTTRWNAFKNNISTISLEKELNKETTWADVLAQLREQLKTQLDKYDLEPAKLSLDFEGLDKKLDDRFFKETNLAVKLGYIGLDSKADLTIEKMRFSLTTRWNAFKNNISTISLEKELNKETTWADVLAQLREQLKTQLDKYDLEPAKLNLGFEGFENLETKLDDRFFKAKDFSVDLGYDNLGTKANLVIEKMHFSLTARWNAFKNNISKISLEKELNKETTWADVLAQLREQLKIQLDKYDLDPAKLSLDFEGLDKKLDDRFFKETNLAVKLGYIGLDSKADLTIEKMRFSLTTRWNAFKNNISTISLEKELNKETTWADVLAQLREQLKIQLDKYDLDPAKLSLDFEGLDKKLDDRFFKETNLAVKLGYIGLDSKADLTIEKMRFSLTTRWNAFKNNISTISLEKELNKETTWADVLAQLREQLKTQLDKYDLEPAKLSLDFEGFEGLDKKLDDRFFKETNLAVKLGYTGLDSKVDLTIEKMHFSLTARWNAFKNNISKISLEKELNKETTWVDVLAQLREQLKTQLDKYDLEPAKLNLGFEGFENLETKLDDRFFKAKDFSVDLGYDNLGTKANLVIEKMHFSLTARWNAFKNNISKISLEKELNKETTWADVLAQLREQLKIQLDKYDLDPAKLSLDFEGFEGLDKKLDDRFFKETNLAVKLGYTGLDSKVDLTIEKMHFSLTARWNAFKNNISKISLEKELNKETTWADVLAQLREQLKIQLDKYDLDPAKLSLDFEGLDKKLDDRFFKETNLAVKLGYIGLDSKADLTIEKMRFSLTTRWNAFKNNISTISLEKELNKETTWADVLAQLREQLKTQLDKYDLEPAKLSLDFEGFEGLDKKLDDRFFKETNLAVKLGYTGLDSKVDLTIEKMHFSLTARWNAFKNNISKISLEKELNKETTWADVLAQLREQLKIQLDKYDLDPAKLSLDFEGLDKKLDDRFFKETNLAVKLGYIGLDSKADLTIEKMRFSLTTRWNAFKNNISTISLEKELNKETTWADVLAQLREQLKTQLDKYDLEPAKLNLGFEGLDKKLDDRFFKETNLAVKLGYTGLDSKVDLTIEKMHFSLTARWNAFKNNISKISLEKELNKETTWADVLAQLREQLKIQLDKYDLDPAKLSLDFEGFEGLDKKLDDRFFKAKDFSVDLGYDNLGTKANLVIEKMHFSLTARWNAFKNNISKISLEKELNKETTWADVLAQLREQLKIQLDKYDLDPAKLSLDFEGFEGLDKKLDDRFFKAKDFLVDLGYDNLETKANLVIEKMHFSLTTRWNAFKNSISSKISLEKDLNKETTWADVLAKLREQLKTQLDIYGLEPAKLKWAIEGINNFDTALKDDKLLKGFDQEVQLGYDGIDDFENKTLTINKLQYSLTTRWKLFINNVENNNLLTSIDWSKITNFHSYKDLIPLFREKLTNTFENTHNLGDISKLSINLFTLQITPLIDQKIGQVWNKEIMVRLKMISDSNEFLKGDINTKIKIKLDLHALTKLFKRLVNDKQPDNVEELKRFLQEMFDYHYPLYKVDAENDLIVSINPPIFNRESAGNFSIRPKNNTKFKNSSINNVIPYYEKFRISLVLFRNALTKILDDSPIENRQELDNIIKKLLDEGGFNKYKKQNIINFNDLDITFKPDDNTTWIKISIALNKKQSWKAISNTPILIDTKHKFYRTFENFKAEFQQYKNLASLRKHLEDQDSYDTWEKLEEIARKWVKDKYASEYKQIFDIANLDVHYFSKQNKLIGKISDIYYEKKEFSGLIFIRLQAANLLYSHYQQINFKLNLSTLNIEDPKYNLKSFIDRLLEKDANNDEETFIKAFIDKLNKIQGFENKFSKTDFKFDFKPATKKNNKIEIKITPINKNKIKGNIQTYNYYEKYMIDLNDKDIKQDIQKLIKENHPDNQEVLEKHLQAYFDSKYNDYDIDVKNHLYITFDKPTFNNLKDGDLNISADQSVRKFKNKLFITIPKLLH